MTADDTSEPFLARWSRRKRGEKTGPAEPAAVPGAEPTAEAEFDLSKLPKIDELTAESDITGFLRKGVPEALKKLALQRMWSLDPAIRDFVEVAENQWDFNAPGGVYGLYQDLAEGTDVSVWMAQAAQSVVGGDQQKLTTADREGSGTAPNATAAAPAPDIDAAQQPAPAEMPAVAAAAQLQQAPDISGQQGTEPKPTNVKAVDQSAPLVSRRRHGGALPV